MEKDEKKFIIDFISNIKVKALPEEIEAVQVFSKQLVEDYEYPKSMIQTHPQFRVKVRSSDTRKEYPIDIAVFSSENKNQDTKFWIPKHFSPYYKNAIETMKNKGIKFIKLSKIADFKKSDEVGSKFYIDFFDKNDTDIPFIRTGDLVNFQVNQIPDKFVPENIYKELNQDLKANDILYTKDGKIGITAMVTENDKVIISSGIERIRLIYEKMKQENINITLEYLFALLGNKWTCYFQALRNTVIAATIPHLRENRLKDFEIPILEKNIIDKITKIVKKSFELKNESKKLDREMLEIFNT